MFDVTIIRVISFHHLIIIVTIIVIAVVRVFIIIVTMFTITIIVIRALFQTGPTVGRTKSRSTGWPDLIESEFPVRSVKLMI